MIRWLSQLWVSSAIDRNDAPPKLWTWTFGRLASHRKFASQLQQLDGQLKRQAVSQQRSLAQEHLPIGDYTANKTITDPAPISASNEWLHRLLKPAVSLACCAIFATTIWTLWPKQPSPDTDLLTKAFEDQFEQLWTPISEQAQTTGQALRQQTTYMTDLPQRLPKIDQVVQDLSMNIETPIREEMNRFAQDMTQPWIYITNQLPRPTPRQTPPPSNG